MFSDAFILDGNKSEDFLNEKSNVNELLAKYEKYHNVLSNNKNDEQSHIKSILSEIDHGYIGYRDMHDNNDCGLQIIKKALNKQVSMDPIDVSIIMHEKADEYTYKCPVCNQEYVEENPETCYCRKCGQKILFNNKKGNYTYED